MTNPQWFSQLFRRMMVIVFVAGLICTYLPTHASIRVQEPLPTDQPKPAQPQSDVEENTPQDINDPFVSLPIAHAPIKFTSEDFGDTLSADTEAAAVSSQFLHLPFAPDTNIRVQQGWRYTWNDEVQNGIDYILGTLDNSPSWKQFTVRAAADGKACGNCTSRLGNAVWIDHENGYYTYYGHLASISSDIPQGNRNTTKNVKRGDVIGIAGDTGTQQGWIHLHFQVNRGSTPVDPFDLYLQDRTRYYPGMSNYQGMGANHRFASSPPSYAATTSSTDPDDNRLLSSGQTLNGTIDPSSDTDTYYFDATQGQRVTLRMNRTSNNLDSYLYLYDPNNALVDQDDDDGGDRNSLINLTLSKSGRYKIITKSWNSSSTGGYALSLTLTSSVTCNSSQYRAEYFNNRTLSGNPTFVRCEGWPINFDWGGGGPGNGIGNDNFSVRWTGTANFNAGSYKFIARADDGVRVWFGGTQIINAWKDQGATEYTHTRSVSSGNHSIKMEYYENGGGAVAQFRWEQVNTSSSNLAKNKTAYANTSENSSYTPGKATDGSNSTRWSSGMRTSLPQWWWVDLGSTQTFDRVVIRWEAAYATRYFIGASTDGRTYYGNNYTLNRVGTYTHDIGTHTARYVGIKMDARASGMNNLSFWEVEVYRTSRSALSPSDSDSIEIVFADDTIEGELVEPDGDLVTIERLLEPALQPETYEIYLPSTSR